ncbi:MAG TPA: hypothetical protein VGI36_05180 [Candidatus Binataceae bacterium]
MRPTIKAGMLGLGLINACGRMCFAGEPQVGFRMGWKRSNGTGQDDGAAHQAVPMTDTGGEMLFYTYEGHHYIFETSPSGVVSSGVQTD